ncbi:uncharacterized protein LOC100256091 isoform X4 [Vitis vinifera]|uniref:uncharacterized protein LOC100256091 isoform X4 n=1 Tax=Vitis vinifera TaxID=29760 RepID=UPI00288317CC|nr:uncharacterized protein LOC100256091 isoform X4 [Vitis vinifera]
MALFDHFHNVYDVAFKPRLLRTLLKDHVPDQNQPFRSPSDLSIVLSAIKTHRLLSESVTESIDQKHIDKWKTAVDSWVDRLLALVSCNMPDKCWAGTCLLGLTCQECSTDRFLASYSVWFHKLLSHIQPAAESHFVKVASCTSISDLLTRLGSFPNAKKDGTSHAGKLIQPVLKLLNEDGSEAEGAVHLLCTIVTFYPSSVQHHYDIVEAAIVSKIMSGKCSVNMLEKLAACLALLPKSRGDEACWFLMMQKVLLSINVNLNEAFQGLEEEAKCNEAIRLLVPPGKDPPPPLGGKKTYGEVLDKAARKSEQLLMSSVTTLMLCCCKMLTTSYPVQVTVPIRPLLALVGRVLVVDGSLSQALLPFVTAIQQEFICSQLPTLHSYVLDLLTAIIKRVRSQLLPHAADIMRLLTVYFRMCALPELRIKVYSVIKILLMSMGIGIAVHLAEEVINNAFADLNPIDQGTGDVSSSANSKASTGALLQTRHRKRKHATTATGSSEEQLDRVNFEKEVPKGYTTFIPVKIAALEALEALLTVGGALRSEHWRLKVDLLLITIATNACKGGWADDERVISLPSDATSTQADFQLAALRALLASLLSPARVRPPYLAQGLELFRRGKQETGTRLAEFCTHALLALEVLIHPRALPLEDFPTVNRKSFDNGANHKYPESMYSGGQDLNTPFSRGPLGMALGVPNPDYDLYDKWLGSDDEIDIPVTDPSKNRNNVDDASEAFRDHQTEKLPSVDGASSPKVAKKIDHRSAATGADMREGGTEEEIMVESHQFPESISQEESTFPAVISASTSTKIEIGKVASDSGALDPGDSEIATGNDVLVAKGDSFAIQGENASTAVSNSERSKGLVSELDNESSMDSFPDIVDADPDSDSE